VAGERLEQLQHPGVGAAGLAGQRPGDGVGDVEVAHADRVRVAVRGADHLGGGPRADTGDRGEPAGGVGAVGALLQPGRDQRGPQQGLGAALLDTERMEDPVRRLGDGHRVGREEQAGRARRRLAEVLDDRPVRPVRLDAGDLLLEDRADQPVEDLAGGREAYPREGPGQPPDQRVRRRPGGEVAEVVAQAGDRVRAVGQPGRARPVPGRDELRAGAGQVQGARAVRGTRGEPELPVGELAARVVTDHEQRPQRPGEVVAVRQRQPARPRHRATVPPSPAAANLRRAGTCRWP
jgi:hypothetical protein